LVRKGGRIALGEQFTGVRGGGPGGGGEKGEFFISGGREGKGRLGGRGKRAFLGNKEKTDGEGGGSGFGKKVFKR